MAKFFFAQLFLFICLIKLCIKSNMYKHAHMLKIF